MIKRLLTIRLRGAFLGAVGGKDKNGNAKEVSAAKICLYTLLYAFIAVIFFAFVFIMATPLAAVLISNGGETLYFGIFMLLSFTAIFVLSIFETKSELFECKDNDLLLSMPIKPRDIVVSRIFTVLFYNYLTELIIMIPVMISYAMFSGSVIGIFGGIYVTLTLPVIATSLSVGVGYLVHIISEKFARFKNLLVIFLSMGFMLVYFVGYTALMENLEGIIENIDANFEEIAEAFSFVGVIGSVALFKVLPLIIYTLLGGCIAYITLRTVAKNYIRIITRTTKSKRAVYKEKTLAKKSPLVALSKKELGRFFSSPTYILNGGLGLVFQIAAAFMIAFGGSDIIQIEAEGMAEDPLLMESLTMMLAPIFIALLVFCQSMVMMSSSALSLEGKSLWILKSMPLKAETVLLSKCMPHLILGCASSLLSGIVVAIGAGVTPAEAMLCITIPLAASVLFAFSGIIINVLFPKFEFVNEAQVVKQSLATFLSMLFNMLVGIMVFIAAIVSMVIGYASVIMLAVLLILVLADGLMYLIIKGPISKKYSTF